MTVLSFEHMFAKMSFEECVNVVEQNQNLITESTSQTQAIQDMVDLAEGQEEITPVVASIIQASVENLCYHLGLSQEYYPVSTVVNKTEDPESKLADTGFLAKTKETIMKIWRAIIEASYRFIDMLKAFISKVKDTFNLTKRKLVKVKELVSKIQGMPQETEIKSAGILNLCDYSAHGSVVPLLIKKDKVMEGIESIPELNFIYSKFLSQFSEFHKKINLERLILDKDFLDNFLFYFPGLSDNFSATLERDENKATFENVGSIKTGVMSELVFRGRAYYVPGTMSTKGLNGLRIYENLYFMLKTPNLLLIKNHKDIKVEVLSQRDMVTAISSCEKSLNNTKSIEDLSNRATDFIKHIQSEIKKLEPQIKKTKDPETLKRTKDIGKAMNPIIRLCGEVSVVPIKQTYLLVNSSLNYIENSAAQYQV